LPTLAAVLGQGDGFLGFLLPYRRTLLVERRQLLPDRRPISVLDTLKLRLRALAWTIGARPFFLIPPSFTPGWFNRGFLAAWITGLDHLGLRWLFLRLIQRFDGYRADAMIDFRRSRATYFDFTFWAFPVSAWSTVVPGYLDFCETFRRRTGFRPALPTEVYFIRKDERALLSFSPNEDIFTLDMVNSTPRLPEEEAYWRWMNREYNDFAVRHGARPLL